MNPPTESGNRLEDILRENFLLKSQLIEADEKQKQQKQFEERMKRDTQEVRDEGQVSFVYDPPF